MGENGLIRAADQHTCQECTQPYKRTAYIITGDDPAALVGMDENWNVPEYVGDSAVLAVDTNKYPNIFGTSLSNRRIMTRLYLH